MVLHNINICIYVNVFGIHIYIYVYIYICMYVHVCIHVYVCTCHLTYAHNFLAQVARVQACANSLRKSFARATALARAACLRVFARSLFDSLILGSVFYI